MIGDAQVSSDHLAAFENQAGPFELFIEMPFAPEAFHIAKLQKAGRIASIDGTRVHLRAVKRDELKQLTWQPWISVIESVMDKTNK